MSKSHRREVAKKLKEAIEATTDPQVIAKLSNELSKYLPRPKQIKRKPSKPAEPKPITQPGRLSKRVKIGSAVDQLSDAEWLRWDMAVTFEKLSREQRVKLGRELTGVEAVALYKEVIGALSEEEVAAVRSLAPVIGTQKDATLPGWDFVTNRAAVFGRVF